MRSSNTNTLTACAVLFLTAGLLSGCADEPEETVNQSESAVVAPLPSEELAGESIAAIEDDDFGFGDIEDLGSTENMDGMDPFDGIDSAGEFGEPEPFTDMLDSVAEGANDVAEGANDMVDGAMDSANDTADTIGGVLDDGVEVTQEAVDGMSGTGASIMEETQLSESVMVDEGMAEVVTATPDIIRNVQQALENAGYNPGPIDGISGSRTLSALESFQQENNIAAGEFTKETLRALGVDY